MTFEAQETSQEGGRPVEIYTFTIGATVYRYTSAEDELVFASFTYFPRQIARSSSSQALGEHQRALEITLPTEDEVSRRFIGIVSGVPMFVQVVRFHRGDTEAFVVWDGRVAGASFRQGGAQCALQVITTEAAFSRPVPRFKFQGLCNHVLYDAGCKVVKADFSYTGTVGMVSGNEIEVIGLFAAKGADWAPAGYVTKNNDYRLIMGQFGDVLTIPLPFGATPTGTVDVVAGCDHILNSDCVVKFTNAINFGGFPYVPTRNPFVVGVRS